MRISKDFFTIDSDLFLGCIYIPPDNSKYTSLEAFNEIESELIQLSSGCDYFSLIGYFNAKTGDTQDIFQKMKNCHSIETFMMIQIFLIIWMIFMHCTK